MLTALLVSSARTKVSSSGALLLRSMSPPVVGAVRTFSLGDTFKGKEKVEEDRFIREQEKKFFERKKAEMAEKMQEQEAAIFQEAVAPAMVEAQIILQKSGEKLSDRALEALARWKLDLKE